MAWLSAVPDPPKNSKKEPSKKSRLQRCIDSLGMTPDMPPTCGLEYLLKYLARIGHCLNTGMGQVGLSYQEIHAWSQLTKIPLHGWESEAIFDLSRSYVSQAAASKDPNCAPPYAPNLKR